MTVLETAKLTGRDDRIIAVDICVIEGGHYLVALRSDRGSYFRRNEYRSTQRAEAFADFASRQTA